MNYLAQMLKERHFNEIKSFCWKNAYYMHIMKASLLQTVLFLNISITYVVVRNKYLSVLWITFYKIS